jgi:hypothetical protein
VDAQGVISACNAGADEIVRLSPAGAYLDTWGSSQIFKYPAAIAASGAGLMYVASSGSSAILTTPLPTGAPPAAAMLLLLGE